MRNRRSRGPAGRRLLGLGGAALGPGNRIVSVTDDGGIALFTTAAPHGLAGDEVIVLFATTGGLYDATVDMAANGAVITPTSFYASFGYMGDATGFWRLAP